jgi:xanthine dehydrogenase YagS FAD-binding subunit
MKTFRHVNARTLDEAWGLLETHGTRARLNAGGTDLLGALKDGILADAPELVINLKGIPGLDSIGEDADGFRIGALTRLSHIQASPLIRAKVPLLAEAARSVATPQLRNMGTLGGNLCQEVRCWYYRYPASVGGPIRCLRKGSGPCLAFKGDNRYHALLGGRRCYAVCPSDMAVALAALDGVVRIARKGAEREVAVRDFYTPLATVLEPGEIVTEVRLPRPPEGSAQRFVKFAARKALDFAVVSAAAVVSSQDGVCADVRIALGAVAPGPVRATAAEDGLRGRPLNDATAAGAAETALALAKPLSKNAYKIDVAKALVRRGLTGVDG